jgi:isopenicillin N synthase-like dioxygenase
VNLGDALAYMTNGLFRSNIHRVVQPPAEQSVLTRFSIVYFSRPENDTILQPIDCSPLITAETDDQNTAQAEPITAGQWIKHRVLYGMKANEEVRLSTAIHGLCI